jgi:hypothetical protein
MHYLLVQNAFTETVPKINVVRIPFSKGANLVQVYEIEQYKEKKMWRMRWKNHCNKIGREKGAPILPRWPKQVKLAHLT